MEHIGFNEKEIKKFKKVVFGGEEWMKYDRSEYDAKQLEEILVQNYPKYEKEVRKIFKYIDYSYILSCIKDTSDYLKQLKNKGYKIYILSDRGIQFTKLVEVKEKINELEKV